MDDLLDQLIIGRWKGVVSQTRGVDPDCFIAAERGSCSGPESAEKGVDSDAAIRVSVFNHTDGNCRFANYPHFFAQLALGAVIRCFTYFDLPAREFPEASEVTFWPTPADQYLHIVVHNRDSHVDGMHGGICSIRRGSIGLFSGPKSVQIRLNFGSGIGASYQLKAKTAICVKGLL